MKIKKIVAIVILLVLLCTLFGCSKSEPLKVKVLIAPHFEIGGFSGDSVGEAQLFYEHYMNNCDKYTLSTGEDLYYNKENGVALFLTGMGKTNDSCSTTAVLSDSRFDFSEAYLFSVGCAGSSKGSSVIGDVVIVSAACDFDLGHTADIRDIDDENATSKWFHAIEYDTSSYKILNKDLVDKAYELTKDIKPYTTDVTKQTMEENFPNEEWAKREPKVYKGTSITSDNYWKGEYDHEKAKQVAKSYEVPDEYAVTEMEDTATATVANKFNMLDRLIIVRTSVNMDVFLNGKTPETLWGNEGLNIDEETLDIFVPAMQSTFEVGKVIIDSILENKI